MGLTSGDGSQVHRGKRSPVLPRDHEPLDAGLFNQIQFACYAVKEHPPVPNVLAVVRHHLMCAMDLHAHCAQRVGEYHRYIRTLPRYPEAIEERFTIRHEQWQQRGAWDAETLRAPLTDGI